MAFLPPLRVMASVRWPRWMLRFLDVRAGSLGDPEPVQGQQGDQRVLRRGAQAGCDEDGADLVAVQGDPWDS